MDRFDRIPDFVKSCPEIELPINGARGWMVQGEGQQVVFNSPDRYGPRTA